MTATSDDGNAASNAASNAAEEVLVLYGSQTGNSESAAEEITTLIPTQLLKPTPWKARCMHLDDFLELERAQWTRLVVIVCSSYGVGQAPIGARKFRDVCDAILERRNEITKECDNKFLAGVSFALLGLGDSHYTTFFQNPTTIHEALTAAGATRIGELGKADASGTGDDEQSKVIERWIAAIWNDLEKFIATERPPSNDVMEKAREETWELCLELFPEWRPSVITKYSSLLFSLCVVLVAILAHQFLTR